MFKYLTRFTDSGRHINNVVTTPPSATRPSYGGTEDNGDRENNGNDQNTLTSEYNRIPSPQATYEVPIERQGAYEDVQPCGLSVPKVAVGSLENSGRYSY